MVKKLKISALPFFLCISAFATDEAMLSKAMLDFDSKNYSSSHEILGKLNEVDSADTRVNYFLGRSAYELGQYETALSAFERVLIVDSSHTRSKLELARCFAALGMSADAKRELKNALADNPPNEVRQNILLALTQISGKDKKHIFEGAASISFGYDSNANANPNESKITDFLSNVYGINNGAVKSDGKRASSFESQNMYARHLYMTENENVAWDSSIFAYNQNFFNNNGAYDIMYLSANTGPLFNIGKYGIGLPLSVDKFVYGHKNFLHSVSLSPRIGYALTDSLLLNLYMKYQLKYYDDSADKQKNSKATELGGLMTKTFGVNSINGGISTYSENKTSGSTMPFVDRNQYSARVGCNSSALEFVDVGVQIGYKKSYYDDLIAAGKAKRNDDSRSYELSLAKKLGSSSQASFSYNYTTVSSNYAPAGYDRRVYLLTLNANF